MREVLEMLKNLLVLAALTGYWYFCHMALMYNGL